MRGKKRLKFTDSLQHVPSSMLDSIATNSQLIVLAVVPSIVAGAAATTNIANQDRDRTVKVGAHVGRITFDIGISEPAGPGVLNYIVFKLERKLAVPTIGVDTVPSNASVLSVGPQQGWRISNPGRIFNFGQIAYTTGTTRTRKIVFSPFKFKKSKIRAGDYIGIAYFNRSDTSVEISTEMRYKEYS